MKKKVKKSKDASLKINTQNLLTALETVNPALAQKEFVETTTHYFFTNEKLITYNDKICISYPYTRFNKTFSIKAKDFYNIIKTIKSKFFICKISNTDFLLNSEDTDAKISINTDDLFVKEMYESLNINDLEFDTLNDPDSFIKGLDFCRFSASKDATNQNFYCVSVDSKKICSSDNYRMSFYKIKELIPNFLIPATSVNELVNFSFNQLCVVKNWVHFKNENGLVFSSRLVSGNYPDLTELLAKKIDTKKIELPKELKNLIADVSLMAKGDTEVDKNVDITLDNNILTCTSKKEIGWLTKKMPINYTGDKLMFQINPTFLSQILNKVNTIELTDKLAFFFTDNFTHLIAANVVNSDETPV